MAWIQLLIAGLFEIAWAVGLKYTAGFTRLAPTLVTLAAMLASFLFLSRAVKVLPIGTAYAVWTGIGAAGTALLGMLLFGESRAPVRLLSIAVIVGGIAGLKVSSES